MFQYNLIEDYFFKNVFNFISSSPEYSTLLERSYYKDKFDYKKFIYEYCVNEEHFTNVKYNGQIPFEFFIPNSENGLFNKIFDSLILDYQAFIFSFEESSKTLKENSSSNDSEELLINSAEFKRYSKLIENLEKSLSSPEKLFLFLFKEFFLSKYIEPLLFEYYHLFYRSAKKLYFSNPVLSLNSLNSKLFQVSFKFTEHNNTIHRDIFSKIPLISAENNLSMSTFTNNQNDLNTMVASLGESFKYLKNYNLVYGVNPPITDSLNIFSDFDSVASVVEDSSGPLTCSDFSKTNFKQVTYFSDNLNKFSSYSIVPNTFLFDQSRRRIKIIKELLYKFKELIRKNNLKKEPLEYSELYRDFFKFDNSIFENDLILALLLNQKIVNEVKALFQKKLIPEEIFLKLFTINVEANTMLNNYSSQNIDYNLCRGNILYSQVPSFGNDNFNGPLEKFLDNIDSYEFKELAVLEFYISYLNKFEGNFQKETFYKLKKISSIVNVESSNYISKKAIENIIKELSFKFKYFYNKYCVPYLDNQSFNFDNFNEDFNYKLWDCISNYNGESIIFENSYLIDHKFSFKIDLFLKTGVLHV